MVNVLDVGTGSGIFTEHFAQKQISVSGVDPNQKMPIAVKEFVPAGDFKRGTIEELPYKDKSFDLVFLGHVLHESDDLVKALTESKRYAKQLLSSQNDNENILTSRISDRFYRRSCLSQFHL